jgi:CRISPR-associated protein Cas1
MAIMKPFGCIRLLAVPTVEVRVVERVVMEVIDDFIGSTLLPWSFAYRKGIAIKDAIDEPAQARDDALWVAWAHVED